MGCCGSSDGAGIEDPKEGNHIEVVTQFTTQDLNSEDYTMKVGEGGLITKVLSMGIIVKFNHHGAGVLVTKRYFGNLKDIEDEMQLLKDEAAKAGEKKNVEINEYDDSSDGQGANRPGTPPPGGTMKPKEAGATAKPKTKRILSREELEAGTADAMTEKSHTDRSPIEMGQEMNTNGAWDEVPMEASDPSDDMNAGAQVKIIPGLTQMSPNYSDPSGLQVDMGGVDMGGVDMGGDMDVGGGDSSIDTPPTGDSSGDEVVVISTGKMMDKITNDKRGKALPDFGDIGLDDNVKCSKCKGSGVTADLDDCEACGGSGQVESSRRKKGNGAEDYSEWNGYLDNLKNMNFFPDVNSPDYERKLNQARARFNKTYPNAKVPPTPNNAL